MPPALASHRIHAQPPRGETGAGAEACRDPAIIEGYLRDASGEEGRADALFRPETEADLAAILSGARAEGVPVTVVAAQTSTTASSVPRGGWILSTERLNRIAEIDVGKLRAVAQAGVVLGAFQDAIEAEGGFYPPDPTSRYECSLGGSVACNASGARTYYYGATRAWVRGLRVVLASGDVLALRRGDVVSGDGDVLEIVHSPSEVVTRVPVPTHQDPSGVKHSGGYAPGPALDLIDLFIGSEGTLGVVSEVEVGLLPAPAGWLDCFVSFPDQAAAVDLVEVLRALRFERAGPRARSIEYFDDASLDLLRDERPGFAIPKQARAALFVEAECHGDPDDDDELQEIWLDLFERSGALLDDPAGVVVASTAAQREELRLVRHAIPVGVNARAARNGMPKLGTDLAVPDAALGAMLSLYRKAAECPRNLLTENEVAALFAELGIVRDTSLSREAAWRSAGLPDRLDAVTFGHLGDNHLHVNFLPVDARGLALCRAVYAHLTRRAIALGGSPSAEHGFGKIKHAALEAWLGAEGMTGLLAVKRALDPQACLGRENLFSVSALVEESA